MRYHVVVRNIPRLSEGNLSPIDGRVLLSKLGVLKPILLI